MDYPTVGSILSLESGSISAIEMLAREIYSSKPMFIIRLIPFWSAENS